MYQSTLQRCGVHLDPQVERDERAAQADEKRQPEVLHGNHMILEHEAGTLQTCTHMCTWMQHT